MHLEKWNGKYCLFGFEGNGLDVFKEAYSLGVLPEETSVFLGSGKFFCVLRGDILRTYLMRDNSNGWHDVAAYSLPDFEEVGTRISADPSRGLHRDTVVIP